ncbi:MAG: ankyrin repeat domain-containing protein, partial [Planctomycetota bacterium]
TLVTLATALLLFPACQTGPDGKKKPASPNPAPGEGKPEPDGTEPSVDLSRIDRGDVKAAAQAVLRLFRARDFTRLAELCEGKNRDLFASVGAQGENHPDYGKLQQGWRWEAVAAFKGTVGEVRFKTRGKRIRAQVHFGETGEGRLVVVVLWLAEKRWWFEDFNTLTREAFEEGKTTLALPSEVPPEPSEETVDLSKVNREDVGATFRAILILLRSQKLTPLLKLTAEETRKRYEEIASGGKTHPGFRYLYSGWRLEAIESWDGPVGEVRFWRFGNRVKAEVQLGTSEGKFIVIVLILVEKAWWFVDLVRTPPEAFETGSKGFPPVREIKPVPELVLAAAENNLSKVKALLAEGADPDSKHQAFTALLFAAQNGHAAVAEVLVANGAEIDILGQENVTPLYMAAQNGHMDVARVLAERGADVNKARANGWTPLHLAAERADKGLAALLIAKGAVVDGKNQEGWTPLHLAAQGGHGEILRLLIAEGADVNQGTQRSWSAMHVAAQNGHVESMEILIEAKADIHARTDQGWTPLMVGVHKGQAAPVNLLLKSGVDVNTAENQGWTALHLAAQDNFMEIARSLIDARADVNAKIKEGATPLDIANQRNHPDMIALLTKHGGKTGR